MAKPKSNRVFLKHFDVEFFDECGERQGALVHVYLDEKKLFALGAKAGFNSGKRAKDGPLECRAYVK